MKKILNIILYIVCGLAMALPFINGDFWILGWVAYAPIILLELRRPKDEKRTYIKTWLRGMLFFISFGLMAYSWLWSLYPLDFAGLDKTAGTAVVLLGWIGIPLLQGLVYAINFLVLRLCVKKDIKRGLIPVTVALLWAAIEWLHTLTWAGIPWTRLAVGQTSMVINIQTASLLGSYFISFLMILTAGYLALGLVKMIETKSFMKTMPCVLIAIAIIVANSMYGFAILLSEEFTSPAEADISRIAVVQPNIEKTDKWSEDPQELLRTYEYHTLVAGAEMSQLVVWPETALPYAFNQSQDLKNFVTDLAAKAETQILVGGLHYNKSTGNLYNSLTLVTPQGVTGSEYYKQKPVPFGEFVPYRNLLTKMIPALTQISMLQEDIAAGTESTVIETDAGKIGALICFDSIYDTLAVESVRNGAEVLVISTNDAWFGSSSALIQHASHAQLRAVETGRYVVRSGNTGISAIITDRGVYQSIMPPFTDGYDAEYVYKNTHKTPYVFFGNIIVLIAYSYIVAMITYLSIKQHKAKKSELASSKAKPIVANKKKKK